MTLKTTVWHSNPSSLWNSDGKAVYHMIKKATRAGEGLPDVDLAVSASDNGAEDCMRQGWGRFPCFAFQSVWDAAFLPEVDKRHSRIVAGLPNPYFLKAPFGESVQR